MKLIYAITQTENSEDVVEALINSGYSATKMASIGGFFGSGSVTLLIAVEADQVKEVFKLLKERCTQTQPNQHAITAFVVDMPIYRNLKDLK